MTPPNESGPGRTPDPAVLDREADQLLAQGRHRLAEFLAHQAAALRVAPVTALRRVVAPFVADPAVRP